MRITLFFAAAAIALAVASHAQTPVPREQPLIVKTTVGSELFKFYCSTCHGTDAKGRAAASPVRPAAPDLTLLTRNSGGVFPRDRVFEVIRHGSGAVPSHGGSAMPVWGAIFRGLDGNGNNDTMVEIRIANLVDFLQSIQDVDLGLGE
jgi:mono/diheme cytochrome c family protein